MGEKSFVKMGGDGGKRTWREHIPGAPRRGPMTPGDGRIELDVVPKYMHDPRGWQAMCPRSLGKLEDAAR
nr:hypothetical protein CFP56_11319 [Quercus suber]